MNIEIKRLPRKYKKHIKKSFDFSTLEVIMGEFCKPHFRFLRVGANKVSFCVCKPLILPYYGLE